MTTATAQEMVPHRTVTLSSAKARLGLISIQALLLVVISAAACQSRAERSQIDRGRAAFGRICSGCHGFDGKGGVRVGFTVPPRDLTDPAFHAATTDEQLLFTLRNGKGQMPAFAALLPESEQLELVAYVRSLKAPGPP